MVSYGGLRCGADHLPSVFAEVERFRSFVLLHRTRRSHPWRRARRGSRDWGAAAPFAARAPRFRGAPTKVHVRLDPHRPEPRRAPKVDGQRSHATRSAGAIAATGLSCLVEGSNAGGPALAPPEPGRASRAD